MNLKEQFLYLFLSLYVIISLINSIKSENWLNFSASYIFKKRAYQGQHASQALLVKEYYKQKKYKNALLWYKKTIKNNTSYIHQYLIDIYLKTKTKPEIFKKNNIHKIIIEYQKLAKAGDMEAQKKILTLSCYKLFPENAYVKSLYKKWKDSAYMMFDCIFHRNNLKIGKDNEKIKMLLKKLNQHENIHYQYEFVSRAYESNKTKYDFEKILKKAISNNYPPALRFYGYIHHKGLYEQYNITNFPKNQREQQKEAIKWFNKFARTDWNFRKTWYTLGDIYINKAMSNKENLEVKTEFKEAIKWYKKAYSLDTDPEMAYQIGRLYLTEDKTKNQNLEEAFKWFYKSASKNYMLAQIEIGDMYLNELGVPENQSKAIKWYKKASKHNSFFCNICYKTDLILNKLGYIKFVKNLKQIYRS